MKRILKDFCKKQNASLTVKLPSQLQLVFEEVLDEMHSDPDFEIPTFARLVEQQLKEIRIHQSVYHKKKNGWRPASKLKNLRGGYALKPHRNARKIKKTAYEHILQVFEDERAVWLFKTVRGDGACLAHSVNVLINGAGAPPLPLKVFAKRYMAKHADEQPWKGLEGTEMYETLRSGYDLVYDLENNPNNLGERWLSMFADLYQCIFVVFTLELLPGATNPQYGSHVIEPNREPVTGLVIAANLDISRDEGADFPIYYLFNNEGHYYPMIPPLPVRKIGDTDEYLFGDTMSLDGLYELDEFNLPSDPIPKDGFIDQSETMSFNSWGALPPRSASVRREAFGIKQVCEAWMLDKETILRYQKRYGSKEGQERYLNSVSYAYYVRPYELTAEVVHEDADDDCEGLLSFATQEEMMRCCQNANDMDSLSFESLQIDDAMKEEGLSPDMFVPLRFEVFGEMVTNCYNIVYLRHSLQLSAKEGKAPMVPVTINSEFKEKFFKDPQKLLHVGGESDRLQRELSAEQMEMLKEKWESLVSEKPEVMKKYMEAQGYSSDNMNWELVEEKPKKDCPYTFLTSQSTPMQNSYLAFHILEKTKLDDMREDIKVLADEQRFDRDEALMQFNNGIHDTLSVNRGIVNAWDRLLSNAKWSIIFPAGPRVQSGVVYGALQKDNSLTVESISADMDPYRLITVLSEKMEKNLLVVEDGSGWKLNLHFPSPQVIPASLVNFAKANPKNKALQKRVKCWRPPINLADLVFTKGLSADDGWSCMDPNGESSFAGQTLQPHVVEMICQGSNPVGERLPRGRGGVGNTIFAITVWRRLWNDVPFEIRNLFREFHDAQLRGELGADEWAGFKASEGDNENQWYLRLKQKIDDLNEYLEDEFDGIRGNSDPEFCHYFTKGKKDEASETVRAIGRWDAYYTLYRLLAEAIIAVGSD